jgi:hypothetical protein
MTGTTEHSAEFSGSVCLYGRRSPAKVSLECTANEAVSEAAKEAAMQAAIQAAIQAAKIDPYDSTNKI